MPRGGARPGAGRPKNAGTVLTTERLRELLEDGTTPLEYLLGILRDDDQPPDTRFEAAKAAAPYCHPRLNSTELRGGEERPIVLQVLTNPKRSVDEKMSDDARALSFADPAKAGHDDYESVC